MMPVQNKSRSFTPVHSTHLGWGIAVVLLNILLSLVFWWRLPPQIPLFYSLPYGTNQLADKQWFFILPGLSLIMWGGYWIISLSSVHSSLYGRILQWLYLLGLLLIMVAIVHILLIIL